MARMANLVENSRARFDYQLDEEYEAGLVLRGFEVKALRAGRGSLRGAQVIIRAGAAYLVGATLEPYQAKNTPGDFDPNRTIPLLLTVAELRRLTGLESARRLTLVPLAVYSKGRRLKLRFAAARRQKKSDQREQIKRREAEREIERTLKNRL